MRGRLVALAAALLFGALIVMPAHAQSAPYLRLSHEAPVPGDVIILKGYGFCGPPCSAVRITRDQEWLGDVAVGADGRFTKSFLAGGRGWVRISAMQQTPGAGRVAHVDQFVGIADDFESQQGQQAVPGVRGALASPDAHPAGRPPSRPVASPAASQQGSAAAPMLSAAAIALVALVGYLMRRRLMPPA